MEETTRAEAIASQVLDLKDSEILVLRLPVGMRSSSQDFAGFVKELRSILDTREVRGERYPVLVLTTDMSVESLDKESLEKIGLRAADSRPYKLPEDLFPAGPLRQAARAGWASAFGDGERADVCALTAKQEFDHEVETLRKLDIQAG